MHNVLSSVFFLLYNLANAPETLFVRLTKSSTDSCSGRFVIISSAKNSGDGMLSLPNNGLSDTRSILRR